MVHILHIDSSPRGERSISRRLTKKFITDWLNLHPKDTITYRDLRHHPVTFVDEAWIAASSLSPEQRTPEQIAAIALSDSKNKYYSRIGVSLERLRTIRNTVDYEDSVSLYVLNNNAKYAVNAAKQVIKWLTELE